MNGHAATWINKPYLPHHDAPRNGLTIGRISMPAEYSLAGT
jgi:hypothetical protein